MEYIYNRLGNLFLDCKSLHYSFKGDNGYTWETMVGVDHVNLDEEIFYIKISSPINFSTIKAEIINNPFYHTLENEVIYDDGSKSYIENKETGEIKEIYNFYPLYGYNKKPIDYRNIYPTTFPEYGFKINQ